MGSEVGASQPETKKLSGTARRTASTEAKGVTEVLDSDELLLAAIGVSQDHHAFKQLFQRYANKIFAMGLRLTGNDQLANDLVQEAMLMVWQKAPLFDLDRGSAQSWIFTLTRNRCFDILRKQKRQPSCVSTEDIWPQHNLVDSAVVNEQEAAFGVEVAQLERFYNELPELQRAVIEQIFVLDRTHEETARALKIPLGTVKSRLRLGMAKLKKIIGVE